MSQNPTLNKEQVYGEDVEVGSEIPPLVKGPYAVMDLFKFGAMLGDFHPAHYDHKWATEMEKVPAVVVFGLQNATHMSQLVTDWIGAHGALKKFSHRGRSQVYAGDTVTLRGKIIKKYEKDGECFVECYLWGTKENGTLVDEGSATVALPYRK